MRMKICRVAVRPRRCGVCIRGETLNAVQQALIYLTSTNGQVTSQIIKDLIADHAPRATKMKALYKRYRADYDGVPIFQRSFEDPNKINNKLNNDFFRTLSTPKSVTLLGNRLRITSIR